MDYFPKILEIAYTTMIKHFNMNNQDAKREDWLKSPEKLGEIYGILFEEFTDKLFKEGEETRSKLDNDKFIDRIYTMFMDYLRAHKLRNIVFDKLATA